MILFLHSNTFNCATVEVWEWISNSIQHFTAHVITFPFWDQSWTILVKGAYIAHIFAVTLNLKYSLKWFRLKFGHLRYIGAFVNKPCSCIETFHTYSINIFVPTLRVDRLYPFCLQRWDTVHITIEYHFSSNLIVGLWTHRSYPINRITYRDACNTTHIIHQILSQDNSLIRKQFSFEWC